MKRFLLFIMCGSFIHFISAQEPRRNNQSSETMKHVVALVKQRTEQGLMPKFSENADPMVLRKITEETQLNFPLVPGIQIKELQLNGIDAELVEDINANKDAILVYIHGGGMMCGNAKSSRGYASMLAAASKLPVYTLSYRLAPEHPFPAGADDCFSVYKALLERHPNTPIFLIGESAGAYYSIVTAMKARDNGITCPAGIVPYSPVIDLSGTIHRNRVGNKDFVVSESGLKKLVELYVPSGDVKNPYVSPYFDDMHDMPPMLLAWDQGETLAADSEAIINKLIKQGIECHFKSYPDCFHAFALLGESTPESREIMEHTIQFIRAHIK